MGYQRCGHLNECHKTLWVLSEPGKITLSPWQCVQLAYPINLQVLSSQTWQLTICCTCMSKILHNKDCALDHTVYIDCMV